jgi:hypothetical protein
MKRCGGVAKSKQERKWAAKEVKKREGRVLTSSEVPWMG